MASIFDDLRDKGNGLLGNLNDFLFNSKSTLPADTTTDPETSGLDYYRNLPLDPTDKTRGQYGGMFDKRLEFYPTGESTPNMTINNKPYVSSNRKTTDIPPPKDPGANTFLGAVGEYYKEAQKTWKDKGGFDALMSNPQFGIGLSLLQQASEGKTIGASALKAMVDGGVISSAYADKIKARAKIAGPITSAEREQARAVLAESDLGETASLSTKFKNFILGKNTEALNARALDDVAQRARDNMEKDATKGGGTKIRSNREYYENAVKELIKEGKISLDPGFWVLGGGVQSTSKGLTDVEKISPKNKRELGGPVAKDKAYLVGEVGPEVFIPKVSGKIVSNDDSKIINLLLEANPHLKSISPARAEKILRNRFPDYFE